MVEGDSWGGADSGDDAHPEITAWAAISRVRTDVRTKEWGIPAMVMRKYRKLYRLKPMPKRKSRVKKTRFEDRLQLASWKSKGQASALRKNLELYAERRKPQVTDALPGQAFDGFYLATSALFRRSRAMYRKAGGEFEARLVTSARSLSSDILLENRIQYSPTEDELLWAATDPAEKRNDEGLLRLVTYSTSVFHEQSHRILWKTLPPPADRSEAGLSRYLNFVEAVVVGIDMALGDELGPRLSSLGYLSGTLYDPGSHAKFRTRREKRNYLQMAIRTTYLALELFEKPRIRRALKAWRPSWLPALPPEAAEHAVARALRLDPAFVRITNLLWQEKHLSAVGAKFKSAPPGGLVLDRDPEIWVSPYLAIERVFDHLGI